MKRYYRNKQYTIKANVNTPTSIVIGTLTLSNEYAIATNEPRRFNSLLDARLFFWGTQLPAKCNVWIEGPRGGTYRVGSKHDLGL